MARGATRRNWIKLYCDGMLHGSVTYQLTDAEQSVWVKLLCLAGLVNRDGQISDNDGRPFPHSFIAHEIHAGLELLEATLKKCIDEGRVSENSTGIFITNWASYQSEYVRQKAYREGKGEAQHIDTNLPKENYGEFSNVLLSKAEHIKLVEQYGVAGTKERIERLSGALASKGYKYKSHYATILTWERMDKKREVASGTHRQNPRQLPTKYTDPSEL